MKNFLKTFILNYAFAALAVAVVSFAYPATGSWIEISWINYFLMIIMFGMGLAINPKDFVLVFTRPKEVFIGCVAQYLIMPLLAYFLCIAFNLDKSLMVGVVLVGTCPGGTASNVITYLAKGDVPLSVGMTSVNTLLSPLLTPFITFLLLNATIEVDTLKMFLSIVNVILVPISLGFIINYFFKEFSKRIKNILPLISQIAILLVISCVVSKNAQSIKNVGIVIFVVIVLHNLLGFFFGYMVGKIFKMPFNKIKAISIEVGMQNSGLATSLAATTFSNLSMATVPGAIFSVWHNISGAILASVYKRKGV